MLDDSMIVYGCAIGVGNRHNHDDSPVILAGSGGTLNPGRHVEARHPGADDESLTSLLDRMGMQAEKVADSTERLDMI